MAETISGAAAILFTAAGVSAAVAAILWFLFGIPSVVRDLAGRSQISGERERRLGRREAGGAGGKEEPVEITMLEEIIYIHTKEEI